MMDLMDRYGADIAPLIAKELEKAVKAYGAEYNTDHEFYAVLREELEELEECVHYAAADLSRMWLEGIRKDDDEIIASNAEQVRLNLVWALPELVQCLAVIEKWRNGKRNKEENE